MDVYLSLLLFFFIVIIILIFLLVLFFLLLGVIRVLFSVRLFIRLLRFRLWNLRFSRCFQLVTVIGILAGRLFRSR